MDLSNLNSFLPALGLITAGFTAWFSVQKVLREYRKAKKADSEAILREAKDYGDLIKEKLDSKIKVLETELRNLENNVSNDLLHIKEVQANEIRNLSDKIESLRQELSARHGELFSLLQQLVNKN